MEFTTNTSSSGHQFVIDALLGDGPGTPPTRKVTLYVTDQSEDGEPEILISIDAEDGTESASFLCNRSEIQEVVDWLRVRRLVK